MGQSTTATESSDDSLLLDTLKTIWQNYLLAYNDPTHKQHWLQLFLFYCQYVDEEFYDREENKSFFNLIPEEICSFLLEQVYEIISKSDLFSPVKGTPLDEDYESVEPSADPSNARKATKLTKLLRKNHNFAQLILSAPSDCNKIVALRTFLTHELGQHLLDFLLRVDCKLIASQKSLCNLCINLFPNCPWNENVIQLHRPDTIFDFIGNLRLYQKVRTKPAFLSPPYAAAAAATTATQTTTHQQDEDKQLQSLSSFGGSAGCGDGDADADAEYVDTNGGAIDDLCWAFAQYQSTNRTSDEIAYMLVQLLGKCVGSECGEATTLTEHSISVVSLNFALDWLRVGRDDAFGSYENAVIIKCELLRLAERCLNNLFDHEQNVFAIQFHNVYAKLLAAIDSNRMAFNAVLMNNAEYALSGENAEWRSRAQILYALNFIMFGVLHNVTAIYSGSTNPAGYHGKFHVYNSMKFIDEQTVDICVDTLKQLLVCTPDTDTELLSIFAAIFKTLLKTIDNLCKYDQLMLQTGQGGGGGGGAGYMWSTAVGGGGMVSMAGSAAKPRRKKSQVRQVHCRTPTLSCHFQGLLFQLMPYLSVDLHEYATRYLLRAGSCCCHYTLQTFGTCLQIAVKMAPAYQRCAYKFLYRKILNAIFVRNNIGSSGGEQKRQQTHCAKCDAKLKSLDFHAGILEQYRHVYEQLLANATPRADDSVESLHILFKHLKHIWHLLTNDIAGGVLSLIVLPVFRLNKAELLAAYNPSPTQAEQPSERTKGFWPTYRPRSASDTSLPSTSSSSAGSLPSKANKRPELHLNLKGMATTTTTTTTTANCRVNCLKTLQECLNLFVIYMSDIRLIKAFYNEENIRHLEELLGEPELIRGICDLIKIGIDNLTFLGDNSHEQVSLSRRLITLQLNSSDHAAQMFNELLRRFAACSKMARDRFWLDGDDGINTNQPHDDQAGLDAKTTSTSTTNNNNTGGGGGRSTTMKPLDVLHCAAMQWSLNYDLLKTSQYFYNEFAKIYSIVMEDDDDDGDEQQLPDDTHTEDGHDDPPDRNAHRLPKNYLKHGDKTIIDILKLNYNALSSFLIFPRKHHTKAHPSHHLQQLATRSGTAATTNNNDEHIYTFTPTSPQRWCLAARLNKADDCPTLSSSLETLISSFDCSSTTTSTASHFPDIATMQSRLADGDDVTATFLQRLHHQPTSQLDESIVLFDIRNQMHSSRTEPPCGDGTASSTPPPSRNFSNSLTCQPNATFSAAAVVDPKTQSGVGGANENGIIGKLFSMFGSLFSGSRSNSIIDLHQHHHHHRNANDEDTEEIDTDLECFYESGGECKKLVLKLFEATMAICIKGYQNEEVEKMQRHLRKLKAIILSNATDNWQQYAVEQQQHTHAARENTIVQALQTLLKIAELSSTLNEPTAVVVNTSSILTTATDDVPVTPGTTTTTATTMPTKGWRARARGGNPQHHHHHHFQNHQQQHPTQPQNADERIVVGSHVLPSPVTPSTPLAHAGSTDGDYFSTRASIICADSEVELSDNDDNECSLIADEGYEADGEIPEISDTDGELDAADLWNSLQPTSRYRSHILHSGLCRLVVDILIELSHSCTRNPVGWADNLAQLANRLYVIRDYLGGSLFLLRGFAPVLESSDTRLKELQQSILELIVDLNTPDLLFTYFGVLSSRNPPVDILIKYMHYICSGDFKKAKACTELEFPILMDGKCLSTSDPDVTEKIERIRNYHLQHQASTPFTRSPCIIPVGNSLARLWHNDGFTVSLWFQAKSSHSHKGSSQLIDDDNRSSSDDYLKTHVVSVGSNQAMLSVYLNSNMNLVFESCKPNADVQQMRSPPQQASPTAGAPTLREMDVLFEAPVPTTPTTTTATVINHTNQANKNISKSQRQQNGDPAVISSAQQQPLQQQTAGSSSIRNAFKHTRQALLNSFNNIHLFNGHGDSHANYEGGSVELKGFRLGRNKWTHLAVAVEMQNDRLEVNVYIDGLEHHTLQLPSCHLRSRMDTFQVVALGDASCTVRTTNTNTTNMSTSESRTTLDSFPMRIGFTNLMLFNRKITAKECILNLSAMGPDFVELTQCQVSNWRPNYGYLNLSKMSSADFGNYDEAMRYLKEHRVLTYSAQQMDCVMAYEYLTELDSSLSFGKGRPLGLVLYGELMQNQLQSVHTAVTLCGGLSSLVYLFARVVELSSSSVTQSLALDLLLNVALTDTQLYAEFQRQDYMSLIGYVVKTERCSKDVHLLKSILNNACSQPVIAKKADVLQVNENTTANIAYPQLIIAVLHRYSDWHRSGVEHSHVLDMLFATILALTRDKHPHRDFNIEQLNRYGLIRELLNLCKVYVIESPSPVYISKTAAEYFVSILAVFAGSPPSPSLMDEIMKLLLLLHKPSECYVTHDRSKFYFLLTAQSPVKEKFNASANLSRVAAPFRRNFNRLRPGVAVPAAPVSSGTPSNTNNAVEGGASRQARINRLRKLHQRHSPYKQPAQELEENLELLADCSRLNKGALRLLSPAEVHKLRSKFKRHSNCHSDSAVNLTKRFGSALSVRKSPAAVWSSPSKYASPEKKISRKRLRKLSLSLSAQSLPMPDSEKSPRRHSRSNHEHNSDSSINTLTVLTDNGEYESSSTASNLMEALNGGGGSRRHKSLVKNDFYSSQGIVVLQEGLLLLLKDFLYLLPDNTVEDVLKHYIKVEYLLVLANHSSCGVRCAILKLLAALVKRLPPNDLAACLKSHYHLHLANQLAIYPTDMQMIETCTEWVTGIYSSLDVILACESSVRIRNRFGLNALLAMMTTPHAQHIAITEKAFKLFQRIYVTNPDEQLGLVECGLLHCCMKALYNLYSKSNLINSKVEQAILELLSSIGERALKSVGHINIVWDILNMLSFYQDKQTNAHVVKGFRAVQAQLQYNWMQMFFSVSNVPWNFKVAVMRDSVMSLAETRTRLDLLVDRCSQLFTIIDAPNYAPTEPEIRFFELLVSYGVSTNQRCNNFVAWGLQPSRPRHLREFIVDALWISCNDEFLPTIIGDGKMIRTLLWNCLIKDQQQADHQQPQQQPQQPVIGNLERLCKRLGIQRNDSTWNLELELERINEFRRTLAEKHSSLLEKTVYKLEALAVNCIESSMVTTRRVAELQNAERKLIMKDMKDYDETDTYTRWLKIIRRMTHEGAPWFSKHRNENSWELDDTEGPSRVHTRLRRCHLEIDKRFFMEDYEQQQTTEGDSSTIAATEAPLRSAATTADYTRPLDYLISSYDQQLNISLNSQILYNFPAKYLPVDGEIDGEMIVTDQKIYFLATYRCKYFYVSCEIAAITEIWLKRYQHQEKAFEVFLDTNQSLFFSLQNADDWKIMRDVFCDKIVHPPDHTKIQSITQQWREGLLTNWEYLMTLNQISGRTYNDLMQYPVFPWILSNYKSDMLNLADASNFRKLEKPIAVQHEDNEQHYINNYTYINNTMTNMGSLILKPYHYSSHYSNSGTVLHFLVRVPPFTSYFLRYQDNNFDLPDRTFHALSTTWCLASRDSPTDVKELIPEFFCLPEMFENFERFNFGCRQSGERVEDVILPPWCGRDPRLFVLIHRQALETELVRQNIHQWIDLIFGYKQIGESAVEAINVFHPATYSMFLESEISDPIERKAVETMVKTYGQMPRQLFKTPHPASKAMNYNAAGKEILTTVQGLRWGVYLGSPQLPKPMPGYTNKLLGAEYLIAFNNTNVVYGLPLKSCIMQGADTDTFNVISWGYDDRIVRIQPLSKIHTKPKNLLHNDAFDDITACGADPNSNQLWLGHRSGRLTVYKCTNPMEGATPRTAKSRPSYVRAMRDGATDLLWHGPTVLVRHKDEITCISLSVEFKIAVTAGRDGIAVIWDLNNWSYIRTIERPAEIHHSPIAVVAISPTLGDIVTVHNVPWHQANELMSASTVSTTHSSHNDAAAPAAAPTAAADDASLIAATLQSTVTTATVPTADECFEVTEENLDDFVNVSINPNGKSILRLHTVNARYVQHIVHEERIHAVCYSYIKEGVGVNAIATAIDGGIVRLWSSWNLSFVCEIATGVNNIRSIIYSTHQHLVVLSRESHIKVWETEGLCGSSPKFPQIAYK